MLKRAARNGVIPLCEKIEAIAAMANDGKSADEAIGAVYKKLDRTPPTKPSATMGQWRRKVQLGLDAGDEKVKKLCDEFGLLEERDEPMPAAKIKRAAKK